MDKELEKYYVARFDLFLTKGWADLMEDIETRINAINTIKGIPDVEQLRVRQGELDTLEWLKSLQAISENAYKQLQEESDGDS